MNRAGPFVPRSSDRVPILGFLPPPHARERMCSQALSHLQSSLSAVSPQWNHPGTVPAGADPADHPAQLAEEQAGGGRALLQVSVLRSRAGRRGSE